MLLLVVPDERLNHDLRRFVEIVFRNAYDDLMAFLTPAKRKLGNLSRANVPDVWRRRVVV